MWPVGPSQWSLAHRVMFIAFALFFKLIFADHWPLFVQWIFVQHRHVLCKTRYHSIWELIWYHWRQLLLFKPCPCMLSTTKKRSPYHQIFASFSRWSHKAMHPCHSRCIIKALFLATTIISNRRNFIRGVAIYSRMEESIWAGALSNMSWTIRQLCNIHNKSVSMLANTDDSLRSQAPLQKL